MITNQVIVVAVLAVIAAVVLGGLALVTLLNPQRTARDRIQELTQTKKKDEQSVLDYRAVRTVTAQVSKLASPEANTDAGNLLCRRLMQAGFRSRGNVEAFSAVRAGLAFALPIMTLLILPEMNTSRPLASIMVAWLNGRSAGAGASTSTASSAWRIPASLPRAQKSGTCALGIPPSEPKKEGFARAVGELVTCPYCIGLWVASGLSYGQVLFPRETRFATAIFSAHALADFLNAGFVGLKNQS